MPMPTPEPNETDGQFINRCMADPTMRSEFGDPGQRLAVCQSQAARGGAASAASSGAASENKKVLWRRPAPSPF